MINWVYEIRGREKILVRCWVEEVVCGEEIEVGEIRWEVVCGWGGEMFFGGGGDEVGLGV